MKSWKIKHRNIDFTSPLIMGIVNVTPDSFSDGGLYFSPENAIEHAIKLEKEGAHILDLGAESTRPNAEFVSAEEELNRLLPVLEGLRPQTELPISIDTTKSEVAAVCLEKGADIINDVSGLQDSGEAMVKAVMKYDAGFVLMHRRGNSQTMQSMTDYEDVTREVKLEIAEAVQRGLDWGLLSEQIVVDPGIGFSKTAEQSLQLLRDIEEIKALGYPILLGTSRKSFLGHVTGREAKERVFATAATVAYGVSKQIEMFRVHDVADMHDVLITLKAIQGDTNVRTFQMGKY